MTTAVAEAKPDRAHSSAPVEIAPPSKSDEAWRFANLKHLKGFEAPQETAAPDRATALSLDGRSSELPENAARLVFANGRLISFTTHSLPEGVIVLPLDEARIQHPDLVTPYFMARPTEMGSGRYAAMHETNSQSGVFVYVPKSVEMPLPVEVFHWVGGGESATIFPHTLVVAEANAKVTVIDHFQSADATTPAHSVGVCDLVARDGAKITHVNTQRWNRSSHGIQLSSTAVGKDAKATSFVLNLGGAWVRNEAVSHLDGPGANSDMLSISIPVGDQQFDQRTLQLHHAPNTTSDLLYKNTLYDKAKTVFAGLIVVDDGAHQTDAYQTCRNLLMSGEVEANSMPGLEINADGVKCSHGSTSGQINEDELFYLMARGIQRRSAEKLITLGFIQEVICRLQQPALEETITRMVEAKFQAIS